MPSRRRSPASRRRALLGPQPGVVGGVEGHLERSPGSRPRRRWCRPAWCRGRPRAGCSCGARTSAGSMPISAANRSTARSRQAAASGRPAPRIGGVRRGRGEHGPPRHLDVRDDVDAGGHHAGHHRQERAHQPVRPGVLDDVEAVVGEVSLPGTADRHVEHLGATVGEGEHRRAAVLGPQHRATGALRQHSEQDILGEGGALGPEPATHVGNDGVDPLHGDPVVVGVHALGHVRALARDLLDEAVAFPPRRRDPGLERARRHPLVEYSVGDDHLGVDRVGGQRLRRHGHVGTVLGVDEHLVGEGRVEVDDRVEGLVVDDDHLRGVDGLGHGLGHDGDDRFTDEPHDVGGEDRPGEGRRHGHQSGGHGVGREIGCHHDVEDAGHGLGLLDVELGDATMGQRGPHELDVGHPVALQVPDVGAVAGEEPSVLDPLDLVAQDAHPSPPPTAVRPTSRQH